jgi:Ca2+-binding RTX toxin-like protein
MATLTAGEYDGLATNYVFTFGDPPVGHRILETKPTVYVISNNVWSMSKFYGSDLTYDAAGRLAGGLVTGWEAWGPMYVYSELTTPANARFFSVEGLSVPAVTLATWIADKSQAGFNSGSVLFAGDDSLTGSPHDDYLVGHAGRDAISGGAGNDVIDGGHGDVVVDDGQNHLRGDAGDDEIYGGSGPDDISGGDGDDRIRGAWDKDAPGPGANYLRGDAGNDEIWGAVGFDDINGNQGNDTAHGGAGDDWIVGGKDNDLLNGDQGADLVYGNLGDDSCDGGTGADTVRGGQGDDTLAGGGGDDWLSGDLGGDTISGGAGADIFHSFGATGLDRITDFDAAEGDRIQLDPGTTYSADQAGADVVIALSGGGQVVLAGVSLASLTGEWIFSG